MPPDIEIIVPLYQDLLRRYPFSITGYKDYEQKLSDFFVSFCRHPIVRTQDNIKFIIGLFAELEPMQLEKVEEEIDRIVTWRTSPLRNLLFFNYEGEYPDLILSYYLTLLSELYGKEITAVNTLADTIRGDVDVKIGLTESEEPSVDFIERQDTLEFRTPKRVIKDNLFDSKGILRKQEIINTLYKYLKPGIPVEASLLVNIDPNNPHIFRIDRSRGIAFKFTDAQGNVQSATSEIFDEHSLNEIKNLYLKKLEYANKRILRRKLKNNLTDDDLKRLASLAIAGAFFAAYFEVDLDYIMSICNVSQDECFTLGGLAIGAKKASPLSLAQRSFFGLISDHVSAVLAAQMIHEWFAKTFFREKAHKILSEIDKPGSAFHQLLETQERNEPTVFKAQQALDSFIQGKARAVLSLDTAKLIQDYFSALINGNLMKRLDFKNEKESIEFSAYELRSFLESQVSTFNQFKFIFDPKEKEELSRTRLHADYRWIKETIMISLQNLPKSGAQTVTLKIYFRSPNDSICYNPTSGDDIIHLVCEIVDDGLGFDVSEIRSRQGGYKAFFDGTHESVLNAHGNVFIESRGRRFDFLTRLVTEVKGNNPTGTKVLIYINVEGAFKHV
jgi:hypothetical protein